MFVQFDQQLVTALRPFVEKAGHRIQKDAWIWKDRFTPGYFEFHGPDDYYLYFRANSAYEARAEGWIKYLGLSQETVDKIHQSIL